MFASRARRRLALLVTAAATVALAPAAGAETLEDALALAYTTNPQLAAARAQLRAQDEAYIRARAQALPSVSGTVSTNTGDSRTSVRGFAIDPVTGQPIVDENGNPVTAGGKVSNDSDSFSYSVSATQNLFRGGQTRAGMDSALATISAQRAQLISTEQQVLLAAIEAYVDVRVAEEALAIRQNNIQVLQRQLQAARDRFEVGEITRTDVAQAEANLATAQYDYAAAQAQLAAARASYERVVGQAPGTLAPEPPLPQLPADLEAAYDLAMESNPGVVAAEFSEQAAKASVRSAKGAMLPSVGLNATLFSHNESYSGGPFEYEGKPNTFSSSTGVGASVRIPLFSGNQLSSNLRASRQSESAARMNLRDAQRLAHQNVSQAWSNYQAALQRIQSAEESVRSNELAFQGVEAEAQVGLRTTLDVLDAERTLLNARLQLLQARREAYVSGFTLLQQLGLVTAENLKLDVKVYDPTDNFNSIRSLRNLLSVGVLESTSPIREEGAPADEE